MPEQHNMEARLADALRDVLGAVAKIGRLPQTVMQAERDMDAIRAAGQKARNVLAAYEAGSAIGGVAMLELPPFDDPRVQAVYRVLCDEQTPPKGEHWEGFAARRIVDALGVQEGHEATFSRKPPV